MCWRAFIVRAPERDPRSMIGPSPRLLRLLVARHDAALVVLRIQVAGTPIWMSGQRSRLAWAPVQGFGPSAAAAPGGATAVPGPAAASEAQAVTTARAARAGVTVAEL